MTTCPPQRARPPPRPDAHLHLSPLPDLPREGHRHLRFAYNTDYRSEATTEPERWGLEDVYHATTPYSDTDRVFDDTGSMVVSASAAMMYPTGWTYAGKLALWYSATISGGAPVIRYVRAGDSGWQNWNTYSNWAGATVAAEGVASGTGRFHNPTQPWVTGAEDGTGDFVRLFKAGAWDLPTSGTCPDGTVWSDRHDPGVIPLPGGQFKMYVQEGTGLSAPDGGHIEVCYTNGATWGDCRDVEFAFDDGSRRGVKPNDMGLGSLAELYECLENIDTIVYAAGGSVYHGAFLKANTWTTNDAQSCFGAGGIVFAELRN